MSGRDASEPKVNMLDHGNKQTNIAIGCKINQNTTSIMQIQNKYVFQLLVICWCLQHLRVARFTVNAAPHEPISASALSLGHLTCIWEHNMCQPSFYT